MKFQKSLLTATLLAAGSLTVANAAVIDDFNINLKVDSTCTIVTGSTADIELGNVAAGQATDAVTGSTKISVKCSTGTAAIIGLIPDSTSAITGIGNLKGGALGAELIAYKLTKDSAAGTAWGSGVNALTTAPAVKYATPIVTTVYATVTDTADVTPGAYTDNVNIAITF